jgi:hypothetical protein
MPALVGLVFLVLAPFASSAPLKAPQQRREHPLVRPVCGALASCTAEACTMPIDITKARCAQTAPNRRVCSSPDALHTPV